MLAASHMASLYRSSTRELPASSIPEPLATRVRAYAEQNQIILDDTRVRVWITRSENLPAEGFFGKLLGRRANPVDPDAEHDTLLLLHSTHLLLGTAGAKRGVTVFG